MKKPLTAEEREHYSELSKNFWLYMKETGKLKVLKPGYSEQINSKEDK